LGPNVSPNHTPSNDLIISKIISDFLVLLKYPERASLVKHFFVRGHPATQLGHLGSAITLNSKEMEIVERCISEAKLTEQWVDGLRQGRFEYFAALVLSRLPELRVLDIQTGNIGSRGRLTGSKLTPNPFEAVLRAILISHVKLPEAVSTLQHLETVRVSALDNVTNRNVNPYDAHVSFETIAPLFYLQHVRMIQIERIGSSLGSWPTKETPMATGLRTLFLQRCELNEQNLDMLLQASPNLTNFQCLVSIDANYVEDWINIDLVRQSLSVVAHSLEKLEFSIELFTSTAIDIGEPGDWGIRGSFGSLVEFTHLTYISLPWPVLLGWQVESSAKLIDVLPRGLRSLRVTSDMYEWFGYQWSDYDPWKDHNPLPRWYTITSKLMEYMECRPPCLEKLSVTITHDYKEERALEVQDIIVSMGRSVGIEVDFMIESSI
jgi:hypothetical protein